MMARLRKLANDDEWYTPTCLLDPVRAVLGVIDLDPASCPLAQQTVQATTYYTKDQDGLALPWYGKVFLNPPYSKLARFCGKLFEELDAQRTTEAVLLVKSITHIPWFQYVARHAQGICFPRGKPKFVHATKDGSNPVVGVAVLYCGTNVDRFCEVWGHLGVAAPWLPVPVPVPGSQLSFADVQERC